MDSVTLRLLVVAQICLSFGVMATFSTLAGQVFIWTGLAAASAIPVYCVIVAARQEEKEQQRRLLIAEYGTDRVHNIQGRNEFVLVRLAEGSIPFNCEDFRVMHVLYSLSYGWERQFAMGSVSFGGDTWDSKIEVYGTSRQVQWTCYRERNVKEVFLMSQQIFEEVMLRYCANNRIAVNNHSTLECIQHKIVSASGSITLTLGFTEKDVRVIVFPDNIRVFLTRLNQNYIHCSLADGSTRVVWVPGATLELMTYIIDLVQEYLLKQKISEGMKPSLDVQEKLPMPQQ